MSFEEEWAQHKTNAAARGSTSTRLNQLARNPDSGAGGSGASGKLSADTDSINGNSHLLIEIAGLLHEGRPDSDLCTMAREPRSHPDVAAKVDALARFANDQYHDTVNLFAALATRLKTVGTDFVKVEDATAQRFLDDVLTGDYIAPGAR